MFAGFRSRWMMPCSCAASRASAICEAIPSASLMGFALITRSDRRASGPSTSSITRARTSPASSTRGSARYVRMIERRQHLRFPPEAGQTTGIVGDDGQQDFDRDLAIERRVARLGYLAHPARADSRRHPTLADASSLEAPCHLGVVATHHRWRLEKARRALVRRQERLHFLAQRLVAAAGRREYAGRRSAGNAPCASEHLFQAPPIIRGSATRWEVYSPARVPCKRNG